MIVVVPLVLVEVAVVFAPPVGGTPPPGPGGAIGPSANADEASKARLPERTSNRKEFFIGRGILLRAKRAQS